MRLNKNLLSKYNIPSTVVVEVDTREQSPILLPKTVRIGHPEMATQSLLLPVETRKIRLDAGDYRLAEFPDTAIVERKGSQLELYKNLMTRKDAARQARAFRRLAGACEFPALMIECQVQELWASPAHVDFDPEMLVHRLMLAAAKYRFDLLWVPWGRTPGVRRKIGATMLHYLIAKALRTSYEITPDLID